MLEPETEVATFRPFSETGARVGARHVLVAGYDPEESRLVEQVRGVLRPAAPFGLTGDLEFMPWSTVPDLASAIRVVRAADRPNAGILIDPLHFDRSDSRMADIAPCPAAGCTTGRSAMRAAERPATTEALLTRRGRSGCFPARAGSTCLGFVRAMPPTCRSASRYRSRTCPHRRRGGAGASSKAADATRTLLRRPREPR